MFRAAFSLLTMLICHTAFTQITQKSLEQIDSLIDKDAFSLASTELNTLENKFNRTDTLFYRTHILKGDLYLSQGDYEKSINAYLTTLDDPIPKDSVGALTLAKGLNDLGIAFYKIGQFDSARWSHHKSLAIYSRYEYPQGLSYNYNNLSIIAKQEKEVDESLQMLEKALNASIEAKDSLGIGFIYLNMGTTYADNTSRLKGLDHVYRAIRVFDQLNHEKMSTRARVILAGLYNRLGSYDSSLTLLKNASEFYASQGNTRGLTSLSLKLAELFISTNTLDSGLFYADQALALAQKSKRRINMSRAYYCKGRIAKKEKEYNRATQYFNKAIEYVGQEYKGQEFVNRMSLAELLMIQKKYDKARAMAEYGLNKVGSTPNLGSEALAYKVLYRSSKALGDNVKAIHWLEKYKLAQDSLYNREKALEMARIEYRDYVELKERQEAAERAKLQSDYEQDLERQKWLQYSTLGGAGLLLIILILIYRLFVRKKRDHQLLEFKNETIQAKNDELQAKNEELQALREKDYDNQQRERRLLQETIYLKERELAGTAMINHEKNSILTSISTQLSGICKTVNDDVKKDISALNKMVGANINSDESWDSFIHQFGRVHPEFFQKLKAVYSNLTVNDLKLCAYIKVGMNNKEIAAASNTALSTVKKNINRLKKKMELAPQQSIRDYLIRYSN
ncbi:MAG: hypothetical protein AAF843_20935 [Bacteroidota bacterium]